MQRHVGDVDPGAAQPELLDLDLLWRRGQFEMARELINAHLAAGHVDTEFLAQAAPCAEGMHDYQLAADLYAWLAESIGDPDTYLMAREHEWRNRWQLGADAAAPWIAAARNEISGRLEETKLRASRERQLALSWNSSWRRLWRGWSGPAGSCARTIPAANRCCARPRTASTPWAWSATTKLAWR